jgi:hypothetical protein
MERNEKHLTPKQERALVCLLSEPTATEAAKKAGVGLTTLMRWLNEEDFSNAFHTARGQLLDAALAKLQGASGAAVDTLRTLMEREDVPPAARISAARSILDLGMKLREQLEIGERLEAIEQMLELMPGAKAA